MLKLVIFDADGTLTPSRGGSCGLWTARLLPGVGEKCARLRAQGATLAIASNQSARRPRAEVVQQLRWTQEAIGAFTVRWATTADRRKPAPAMLNEILRAVGVSPSETLFVGDQQTDFLAAQAAGVGFMFANVFFAY